LALGVMLTSACGKSSQQAAPPAPKLPPGIITTGHPPAGIYPAYGEELCCWVADDVRFDIAGKAGQTIVLSVFQPKAGPLATHDQSVRLIGPDGKIIVARAVHSGASATLSFPLSGRIVRDNIASIHLSMSGSFVPKALGTSADIRRLSMILAGIHVR